MIGIYIHIPFCEKKCVYCDFYSITNKNLINDFVHYLSKEIELFANNFQTKQIEVETIYFGGGTPSILNPFQLNAIIELLDKNFKLSNLKEFTIECNPGTDFISNLPFYKEIGINRISIGVQSLIPSELKFLGRIHSVDDALISIEKTLEIFENVSVDIIFSIPNQAKETLSATLHQLLDYEIKHISAYSLIYEEGTPLFLDLQRNKIIPKSEDEDYELYRTICKTLKSAGFEHYEVSNFAKDHFKSLHNLRYWTHKEYLGFGPSSHSFFQNTRFWNSKNIFRYFEMLANEKLPREGFEIVDKQKKLTEKLMLGLRSQGLTNSELKAEFGIDLLNDFSELIEEWKKRGLAVVQNQSICLTDEGYFVCDKLTLDLIDLIEKKNKHKHLGE